MHNDGSCGGQRDAAWHDVQWLARKKRSSLGMPRGFTTTTAVHGGNCVGNEKHCSDSMLRTLQMLPCCHFLAVTVATSGLSCSDTEPGFCAAQDLNSDILQRQSELGRPARTPMVILALHQPELHTTTRCQSESSIEVPL
jgi:hypothetical protein